MRIVRNTSLVVAVLFATLGLAEAQAERAELSEGGTLWGILETYGCSEVQIANTWRLVAEDSGLDPEEHEEWSAGTSFAINRDCEGNSLSATAELEELRSKLIAAEGENQRLGIQLSGAREELALARFDSSVKETEGLAVFAGWGVSAVLLLVCLGLFAWNRAVSNRFRNSQEMLQTERGRSSELADQLYTEKKRVFELKAKLARFDEALVFPKTHDVHVGDDKRMAALHVEPRQFKLNYECPFCAAKVFTTEKLDRHIRVKHPDGSSRGNPQDLSAADEPVQFLSEVDMSHKPVM